MAAKPRVSHVETAPTPPVSAEPISALASATAKFEAKFSKVVQWDANQKTPQIAYRSICSGGEKAEGKPWPTLSLSEDLAVEYWLQSASTAAGKSKILYWRTKPELDWERMTEQDARGTQRLVADRCAVYSRMAFGD